MQELLDEKALLRLKNRVISRLLFLTSSSQLETINHKQAQSWCTKLNKVLMHGHENKRSTAYCQDKFQVNLMWHFITQNYTKPKQLWSKAAPHSNQLSGNQTYLHAIASLMFTLHLYNMEVALMHLKLANQSQFNTPDQIGCIQHRVVRAAKQKSSEHVSY